MNANFATQPANRSFLYSYRSIARILIISLWVLCLGATLFLARYGQLLPETSEADTPQTESPQMTVTDSSIVFNSSGAFMDYFRLRYSEAELAGSLQQSPSGKEGAIIEVKTRTKGKGEKFEDKYKVKYTFRIKPVPQ